jgi:serine/threonine protein kinase
MNISNYNKFINLNNNSQQLNITTLVNNNNQEQNVNDNVTLINTIFNNSNTNNNNTTMNMNRVNNKTKSSNKTNKYEIKQYLGEGIKGSLYMAFDKNNVKYICKKIQLDKEQQNHKNQLLFELNLLKFLSSNRNTREYINPCLEYKIIDNQVFTIFPIFNGYSLNHLKKYLFEMNHNNYYKILFHLIKVILHGLSKIHQHNVAHQNINDNSILVSTNLNPNTDNTTNEMKVKFTDFGLGCGVHNNYLTNTDYNLNKCKSNTTIPTTLPTILPTKITNNVIKNLSNLDYLSLAQKNDIELLCMIFIQLLLYFEKIQLDLSQGYNNIIKKQIKQIITEKFLSQINNYRKKNNNTLKINDSLIFLNTNNETKRDLLEYLSIFNDYILCEDKHRQPCQYILDKLILYEKYKHDEF